MPSYRFVNVVVKRMKDSGVWKQLSKIKRIIIEGKDKKKFSNDLAAFKKINTDLI